MSSSGWLRYDDAPAFLMAAHAFLMSQEALNNMILSSSTQYIQKPPQTAPLYATYQNKSGVIVGALVGAVDRPLLASTLPPEAAQGLDEILQNHPRRDVMAPEPTASIIARRLEFLIGQKLKAHSFQMHVCEKARALPLSSGQMRRAWIEDTETLLPWMPDSARASSQSETPEQSAKFLNEMIIGRRLFVWADKGELVSMAAFTGVTLNSVRIVSVYTPPEKRKRGYARSLVLKLTELQRQLGKRFCVLFTDPENPTSNKIYAEAGYQPHALFTYYFVGAEVPVPTGGAG